MEIKTIKLSDGHAPTYAILMFCTFILTACASDKQWSKAGATGADVERAKLECKYEAAKHDVSLMKTTWESELQQQQLIEMCMKVKGYSG